MMFCANKANLRANKANPENLMKTMLEHEQDGLPAWPNELCDIAQTLWPNEPVRPLFSLSPFLRGEG
jgi:hypothetical protein